MKYPRLKKHKSYRMHNSDAISILNCAFDNPAFFSHRGSDTFVKVEMFKSMGCESTHVCFLQAALSEL